MKSKPKAAVDRAGAAKQAAATVGASKADADAVGLLGFHPEAERVLIILPIAVFMLCLICAGPLREPMRDSFSAGYRAYIALCQPLERVLVEKSNLLVAAAALVTLAPLGAVVVIQALRAAGDLRNLTPVQQVLLAVLMIGVLASFVLTGALATAYDRWLVLSSPLGQVLAENADSIILGTAIVALGPLALAVAWSCLRCIWGCRVKITVEKEPLAPVEPMSDS